MTYAGDAEAEASAPALQLWQHVSDPIATGLAQSFRRFVAIHVLCQFAFKGLLAALLAPVAPMLGTTGYPAVVVLLLVALGAAAVRAGQARGAKVGIAVLFAFKLVYCAHDFPFTANHDSLETLILGILLALETDASKGDRGDVDGTAVHVVQAAFMLMWFYSGVQKLVRGWWVHGEFLALGMTRPVLASFSTVDAALSHGKATLASVLSWATIATEIGVPFTWAVSRRWARTALVCAAGLCALVALATGEGDFCLMNLGVLFTFAQPKTYARAWAPLAVVNVAYAAATGYVGWPV
ncbi:MAG TPA: hypothetical protein VHB21_03190 [Minicystis sp.]|nr:hypothetical protein [Minicystis sp.]